MQTVFHPIQSRDPMRVLLDMDNLFHPALMPMPPTEMVMVSVNHMRGLMFLQVWEII